MNEIKIERKGKLVYFREVKIGQFFRHNGNLYLRVDGSYVDDTGVVLAGCVVCIVDSSIRKFHSQQQVTTENYKLVEL